MAKDSLVKASTPEPFSKSKTSNWVARGGGLPAYIQHIAHDLMEKRGFPESKAIQLAIGIVKRWARGGGKVDANTRAAASKAVAEWEKLKAGAAAKRAGGKLKEGLDLERRELSAEDLAILETIEAPVSALFLELTPEQIGDLSLLEAAAKPTPMSNTPRRPGESLTSWGKRLKAGDASLAAKQAKATKTRGGTNQDFNAKHPRTRGGKWTFKSGASGAEVRGIQSRVGAKVDGAFGNLTKSAVMAYQRRHGLQVDGVVGAQTVAAMRGRKGNVSPGAMSASDRAWLTRRKY